MKPKPGYWILWGVRVGLLSFLFLGLIYPSMSPAGAEGVSPPFGFSQSTTVVLNNETPSEVFLLNKTGETHTVELWLTDFNFKPLLADAEVRWPVVKLEAGSEFVTDQEPLRPLTVKLDGKQPQRILLSLNGAEQANVKPGTYTAFLMASEASQSLQMVSLQVQVVVEKKPTVGLPKPLLETVTLQALRPFPWLQAECSAPCLLPLDVADDNSVKAEAGQVLGFLVGPQGEYVQVEVANGSAKGDNDQPVGLDLAFKGLDGAGAYTGKLDLTKAADKSGVVTVTVKVKDAAGFPLFVLMMGIMVAWWAQRYIAVGRKVEDLRKRKADLEKGKLRNGITIDLVKLKGDIFPYEIDGAQMATRFKKLEEQFRALKKIPASSLEDSNNDYKAAIAELDAIESQIELWQSFGGKYGKLKKAFNEFTKENLTSKPNWPVLQQPAFYADAVILVEGFPSKLADVVTVAARVDKAAELLNNWDEMSKAIADYRTRVQELLAFSNTWQEAYRLDLYSADRILCQAWGDLWLAKDADDLVARSASADIQHAEALLLGLHDAHLVPTSSGVKAAAEEGSDDGGAPESAVEAKDDSGNDGRSDENNGKIEGDKRIFRPMPSLADLFSIFGSRAEPPADIDLIARYSNLLRWLREGAITLLALLIALSAAAATLYIDKNFGTLQDYIAAFTWGVTSKALVSSLDFAIGNFRGTLANLKT